MTIDDADFDKLEASIRELLEANQQLSQVCETQRSIIKVLVQQRDAAMDYNKAMEAMRKP